MRVEQVNGRLRREPDVRDLDVDRGAIDYLHEQLVSRPRLEDSTMHQGAHTPPTLESVSSPRRQPQDRS